MQCVKLVSLCIFHSCEKSSLSFSVQTIDVLLCCEPGSTPSGGRLSMITSVMLINIWPDTLYLALCYGFCNHLEYMQWRLSV